MTSIFNDLGLIEIYERAFHKVFTTDAGRDMSKLSGCLRQGERSTVYTKDGVLRFEMSISGSRIKELTGSQRVPDDAAGVERVLLALEERYLPLWCEMERHRSSSAGVSLGDIVAGFPRIRNRAALDRVAEDLGRDGKILTKEHSRGVVEALRTRGLVENLLSKTKVRGYRVSSPASDALWRAWGKNL